MNLAEYLSELLGQHDEVNVPGLGYFVRSRVNAYYNNNEARFYPPYHQVKFIAQPKEDDAFAQYVAEKKNISLASSKYFVEKFTTKLKEDASRGKYLFADLGSFQTDLDQLIFKPNERIPADPEFYGYPPVDIFRPAQVVPADTRKTVLAPDQPVSTPIATPFPTSTATATTTAPPPPPPRGIQAPDYYEEEVEQKRGISIWLIILIIGAILGLAAFGVYKFYPGVIDKVKDKIMGKTVDTQAVKQAPKPAKKDTAKKVTPADTSAKAVTPTAKPDTLNLPRFEAVVDKGRPLKVAEQKLARLKARGFNAYIVPNTIGPMFNISVGQYATYIAADSVIKKLLKQGVIFTPRDPLEIDPKKQ